jgi:ketosteroid isomerase-like protein
MMPGRVPARYDRDEERAVREADHAWAAAVAARDLDRLLSFYAPNAVFITPEGIVSGPDDIGQLWSDLFRRPGYSMTWSAARVEVASTADVACSSGPWRQTEIRDGQPQVKRGIYVAVWKLQVDGRWKVVVEKP